jgi:hypothetical protein
MNKSSKILFFVIFAALAIILIYIVNLVIKKYEREAVLPPPLPRQVEMRPMPLELEPLEEDIEDAEEIEEEGVVSGPLLY